MSSYLKKYFLKYLWTSVSCKDTMIKLGSLDVYKKVILQEEILHWHNNKATDWSYQLKQVFFVFYTLNNKMIIFMPHTSSSVSQKNYENKVSFISLIDF